VEIRENDFFQNMAAKIKQWLTLIAQLKHQGISSV
jgi:hypothetical protein